MKVETSIQYVDDAQALDVYQVALMNEQEKHLSMIHARCNKKNCHVKKSPASPTHTPRGFVLYDVVMTKGATVAKGEEGRIQLTAHYTHSLSPYPAEVTQKDQQYAEYYDAHLWPSPYTTDTQTTTLKCPSKDILSYSEQNPVKKSATKVTYGPYTQTKPYASTFGSLKVHFHIHAPFLTLTNVVKEIEVSMWGQVSVEEVYDLSHTGAKLKGGFSRLDYQYRHQGAAFSELRATLPKAADHVYYRDIIGNITTSRLRPTKTHKELELKPRFPIFGGWKTQWYMGYTLPSSTVMVRNGNEYNMVMEFSTPIKEATVDALTLKVILPEGAKNIRIHLPFQVDAQSETKRYTYLDSTLYGRPVLIVQKKNLIPEHNVPFKVTFDFDSNMMWHEPLLLVAAYFVFFLVCVVLLRLDVSLSMAKSSTKTKTKTE